MSWFPYEKETLIPPYTAIKMNNISELDTVTNYEVLVTQDNKYVNFDLENYSKFLIRLIHSKLVLRSVLMKHKNI